MKRILGGLALILVMLTGSSSARVWYVEPDSTGQAINIQAGIDSCAAGDTVVAMPGIYTGDGNWDIDFKGKPIAVMAARSFDPAITDKTIIDGFQSFSHRVFYFHSGEDSTSTVSGFMIRGFFMANGTIRCDYASPTIFENEITRCGVSPQIQCIQSSARIIKNLIFDISNVMDVVACDGGSPYFAYNRVKGNDCGHDNCDPYCYFRGCTLLKILNNSIDNLKIENCAGIIESNSIGYSSYGSMQISGSTLTIMNNEISAYRYTALVCWGSALIVANNRIRGGLFMGESLPSCVICNDIVGAEEYGLFGAIRYDGDSTTVIENNIIHDTFDGPGIECYSSIRIAKNVIYSNGGHCDWGGGVYCGASPVIEGNTIVSNMAWQGAGVYCAPGSSPILRNNIIANNMQCHGSEGAGIYTESPSITVECCDVFGNEGGNYVGIPDQTGLNGNISQDPLFCDSQHDKLSLYGSSPCLPGNHPDGADCGLIGALNWSCGLAAPHGLIGRPLYIDNSVVALLLTWNHNIESNVSHYEVYRDSTGDFVPGPGNLLASPCDTFFGDPEWRWFPHYYYKVTAVDSNGYRSGFALLRFEDITGVNGSEVPQMAYLSQNYPNPFNPVTRIEFGLRESAQVSLRIYDAAGRLLRVVCEAPLSPGHYVRIWDGRDASGGMVASGVYFYRLNAGSFTKTRKMVLLR